MEARGAAVDCLAIFSTFTYETIAPYKEEVLAGLVKALDDKKRIVRKKAAKCRNDWFLIGK